MKLEKRWIIIGIVSLIVITIVILLSIFYKPSEKNTIIPGEYRYVPLSQVEIEKVASTIVSSEFIKDVPKNNPVALTFFDFDEQRRVWKDSFLIGNNQLLSEGEPSVSLALHSKYISQLDGTNLCEVIKEANKNGDLAFNSEYSNAKLLIKYAGMMKHRDCFGF